MAVTSSNIPPNNLEGGFIGAQFLHSYDLYVLKK